MTIERTYIIPLRKEFLKVQYYKKSKKAVTAVKEFLEKHMKSDNIKLGKNLNMKIWERGITNPPSKVKVTVIKEDDGTVKAELFGIKYAEAKKETKKEKETAAKKTREKKEKETKKEEIKTEKTEEKTE